MRTATLMDEEQLVAKAVDVLFGQLGPVEASRFLSLPRGKRTESVRRHRSWQAGLDKDRFFNEVFGHPPPDADP